MKKNNYKLLLSNQVSVSSDEDFLRKQESRRKINIFKKVFSRKSTSFFIARIYFWWLASNKREKISLPLRLIISIMLRGFKNKN